MTIANTQNHDVQPAHVYETIDEQHLEELRQKHAWIVEPIYRANAIVLDMPFFGWVRALKSAKEFAPAARQLYHHSATFPKVMGIMLGLTPMSENSMMPFYAKHAYGEADHHMLLAEWMLKHGVIASLAELDETICSIETNACVNYALQMALERDRNGWLVGLNSGIERCSNDFFKVVSPKMHELGAGHIYFDTHVDADEHHSIMGLEYIEQYEPSSREGARLIAKALEGLSLWAAMLHSWIGLDIHPRFSADGSLVAPRTWLA